jgi:hypothetical protein
MNNKYFILNLLGWVFLIFDFLIIEFDLFPIIFSFIIGLAAVSLWIPDAVSFWKRISTEESTDVSFYWKTKLIGLPIAWIVLFVGLIIELVREFHY